MSDQLRDDIEAMATYRVFPDAVAHPDGGAPPEPSEEAIEAAREASAHTAELGMDDVLMSRRVTLKILRAAYAIDFGRAASRPGHP
jgi:hypothetical protein